MMFRSTHPPTAMNVSASLLQVNDHNMALSKSSCLVGILANTPGGVKRSGLGAHAVGLLVVY